MSELGLRDPEADLALRFESCHCQDTFFPLPSTRRRTGLKKAVVVRIDASAVSDDILLVKQNTRIV